MSATKDWLYRRLKSEPVREHESARWNSIISRLSPLIPAGDSSMQTGLLEVDGMRQESAKRSSEPGPDEDRVKARLDASHVLPGAAREKEQLHLISSSERQLVSLAAALIGKTPAGLSDPERKILAYAKEADPSVVARARRQILAGEDALGSAFCALRSADQRRERGATYTPASIVEAMLAWALAQGRSPARVVDPGAGSGRFLMAAARLFHDAELIAVEIDPVAALMLRANAAAHGFAGRLTVHLADYRSVALPAISRPTLFIGNPPYVRHHDIGQQWKVWFAATAKRFGLSASKLAGLHIHFFLKTRELGRPGDYGCFITAAEWLDVNYGSVLRNMFLDGLGGTAVHIIDPKAQPFTDALTTGAITCFHIGSRPSEIAMQLTVSLRDLIPLGRGRAVHREEMASANKWSVFVHHRSERPAGFIELGELFRVHRGQVTGNNEVWIDSEAARDVPTRFKPFTVTSARELLAAGAELASTKALHRVVDLPPDLSALTEDERKAVQRFIAWARRHAADESYIARHRRPWWSVRLRAPAPILCTYMARRAPVFVRNRVQARHINIAHGLYPRVSLMEAELRDVLLYLRSHASASGGRTYAGGLIKFEPRELERILLPRLEDVHGYLAEAQPAPEAMDSSRAAI